MRRCSPNLCTFIASNLSFNYLWIFKVCVFCQIFPHSSQLTCHPIISEFSNVALSSNHLWIFKLCVVRQMFPHSMQITRHPIIYVFSNEALFAKPFQTHHEARQRPILKIGQGKGPFHQNTETKNSKLSGRQNITYQNFPDRVCKLFSQQKRAKSA